MYHAPVITPLTPELFAPLFEHEAQAASLEAEYQTALSALREHVNHMRRRMEEERNAIKAQAAALEGEEAEIKAAMQTAAKERARAALRQLEHQDGPQLQAAKLRLLEIPAERAALEELIAEIDITPEEQARYERLYETARSAGEATDQAKSRRDTEIKRLFPIVKDQFEAATWSASRFYDKDLSGIETAVYSMRECILHGKKIY